MEIRSPKVPPCTFVQSILRVFLPVFRHFKSCNEEAIRGYSPNTGIFHTGRKKITFSLEDFGNRVTDKHLKNTQRWPKKLHAIVRSAKLQITTDTLTQNLAVLCSSECSSHKATE